MSGEEPDVTRMDAAEDLGGRTGGKSVEITKVDGGFIVSWKEAVVIPESKRKATWDTYHTVTRTAVREKLEAALEVVRAALLGERISGTKWG